MARKKLLAYRNFSGVGDWIITMTVLKMVNRQYPDIDIYLNMLAKNNFAPENYSIPLPDLVFEIIEKFDVDIKEKLNHTFPRDIEDQYDYCTGHMGYKRDGTNFIEGMVKQFNLNTGLELIYEEDVLATYQGEGIGYDNTLEDLRPYVLIQACSKMKKKEKYGKDYGFNNMCHIADTLSFYMNVVQIGKRTDYMIPYVDKFLGVDLDVLHRLMVNSTAFIGMDGGLGVYASHHNVRQYIIYEESRRFSWTAFPNRTQINGQQMEAGDVADFIVNNLRINNETAVWQNACTVS